ncbi:splicing factor U2af large subunit A [Drosophila rhopaloa]|uniref:Splicing factor U2af large subunit A n=1 Tax=Drosophila rhopaloa TaxID=1041015 RepID=A0A6P4EG73_DRORH|nr:splicing factor U2af large subunit A [Drosophila rhopaloa]
MSGGDREQLRRFVAASRRRLHDLLERLHWSEQGVLGEHQPTDDGHAAEISGDLPPSCCTNSAFSVKLDETAVQQIIGKDTVHPCAGSCFDDLQAGLSASHRLLIYEHVLQHTERHPEFEDNAAFAELVGETRRERKKQRRHRKSKPTLNEELHQLVDLQMQALQRQRQKELAHKEQHRQHKERHREHTEQRHQEHKEWNRDPDRSRKRSRSRSRSPNRQRHGHRRREEREPRSQHYSTHRSHTSRH